MTDCHQFRDLGIFAVHLPEELVRSSQKIAGSLKSQVIFSKTFPLSPCKMVIFEEVNAIFKFKNIAHILLVDDARSFNGQHDYPTVEELTNHIKNKNNKYEVVVKDDIIRYVVAGED